MIPKIIHYCWFGRGEKPALAKKCIASWRKFFPDYEIKEWNEGNFDVNIIPYTAEAYACKKYAFVSDYARFWVLYKYGGLYFDTDVEVIRPMDDIVARGPFMGIETPATFGNLPNVAPGLGLGVNPGLGLYDEILDYYKNLHFLADDGKMSEVTVVTHVTTVLKNAGLQATNEAQCVNGVWIYPVDYFNPFNDLTGKLNKTANTRTIHWYSKTWMSKSQTLRNRLTRMLHRLFGVERIHSMGIKIKSIYNDSCESV